MSKTFLATLAWICGASLGLLPAVALAQTAYAITPSNQLLRFDVATPGTAVSVPITGLVAGDSLAGIDFRPATGQLYALGNANRLYTLNTVTGVATQVGTDSAFALSGTYFGIDVNPVVDRIRVVSDFEQNLRINPDTGALAANDSPLAYNVSDPNNGVNPNVAGIAYAGNVAGATVTTVYAIDTSLDTLAILNPPNTGVLTTVGPLGVNATAVLGFDIRTVAGVDKAYAALQVDGFSRLYTINLATGAATLVGSFAIGPVTGLAVAPPPFDSPQDLNGDLDSDIVYRNSATGQVYRLLMNGFSVSGGATAYHEPNLAWNIVGDGDFNGDGRSDLLWRNSSTGQVYVMPFNASGLPTAGSVVYTEPNAAWKIVHTPDLNGDGRADLLWRNSSTGQVYAMLLNGSSVTAQGMVHTEPDLNWRIQAVGDLAGSGKQNQLVWRNSATGQVYLMTVTYATGIFMQSGSVIFIEPNNAWNILGAPDLNGDGRSDLIWGNASTGQVYGMLMNGGTTSSQAVIHNEPNTSWKIVAFGDYNGDGKSDLLWRNESTGQLHMMRMNGLSIVAQQVVYVEPNLQWYVVGPYAYAD